MIMILVVSRYEPNYGNEKVYSTSPGPIKSSFNYLDMFFIIKL
jgi:hypothetical protein